MKKRITREHLDRLADLLSKEAGDLHYIYGPPGELTLIRSSDGAHLFRGTGIKMFPRLMQYLRNWQDINRRAARQRAKPLAAPAAPATV